MGTSYVSNQVGFWETEAAWTPNGNPGSADSVTILHLIYVHDAGGHEALEVNVNDGGSLNFFTFNRTLTIGNDLVVRGSGTVIGAAGTLAVGGDLVAWHGSGDLDVATDWTVAGRFVNLGRALAGGVVTVTGEAIAVGGSIGGIDASGGSRLVGYGSDDIGSNTNVVTEVAQTRRAVLPFRRRAYFAKVA